MNLLIEIPRAEDYGQVNKLAKQVHELHVKWRPDLFLNVDKVNSCTDMYLTVNKENESAIKVYEKFGFKVKSIAYSMTI